jgi:hypothetical protein
MSRKKQGSAAAAQPQTEKAKQETSVESVPVKLKELSEEVTRLLDLKIILLKEEIREDIREFLRDSALVGAGGILATVGFTLLHVPQSRRIGAFYLLAGGATALVMGRRLAKLNPLPERSLEEIKRDAQWLKSEL